MEETIPITHKISRITLERRWEYLKDLEFNSQLDYNLRFLKTFNVKELIDYVHLLEDEHWEKQVLLGQRYSTHKNSNAIIITKVDTTRIDPLLPFNATFAIENQELINLIMPIANEIANLYDGKYGRIWLAKLPAGKQIPLHSDGFDLFKNKKSLDYYYLQSVYRVHIPLITNEEVIFIVNNEKKHLKVGEAWDINQRLPHTVENNSKTDRIHLVIDILPYKWL